MTAPFRSNCLAAVGLVERANYLSCRPATVVMPSLSVSAFYCPATVEVASAISPALSAQLQIACLFLRSSVPILDSNIKSEMRSFKSNENIHKKEGGPYYVVSANKASSVTL